MSNAEAAEKRMYVGRKHAGEVWSDILEWFPGTVTIDRHGYGEFPVAGMSVSVWVNVEAEGRDGLNAYLYVPFPHIPRASGSV